MKGIIKILVAEDNEDDFELLRIKLKKEGLNVQARRVEKVNDFKRLIKEEKWDLIISDNNLPDFDAQEAVKITREHNDDIPFIIVSGTIGEEAAVKAMKTGANDYLLKGNLTRLGPSIKRELEDFANRQKMASTELKLKESQANYELLAQNVQDLVCVYNAKGEFAWVSPSSVKILGLTSKEMMATKPFSRLHPDDREKIVNGIFKPMLDGRIRGLQRFNYRKSRKDGLFIHLETLAEPVYEKGKLFKIISTTRDITEQITAIDLLEENKAIYEGVLECLSEGVVLLDKNERIIAFNKSAEKELSLKNCEKMVFSEVILSWFKVIDDQSKEVAKKFEFVSQTLNSGKSQFNRILGLKKQKRLKWLSCNCVPYEIKGDKQGAVVSFKDITEEFNSKEKLNRLATELVTLIETANAPIFGINETGDITVWNTFATNITGYTREEAFTKNLYNDLIIEEDRSKVYAKFKDILENNYSTPYELPIITKQGKIVTILINGSARRNYKSKIIGIICVGQDITELSEYRTQLEHKVDERTKELEKALANERELVQLKSKFVSMASHEFRTPLSTIKFAADFIAKYQDRTSKEKIHEKISKIDEQVRHMTYLLDDVLTIGKTEAGKIKVCTSSVNLKVFCEQIIEEVSNQSGHSHKINFKYSSERNTIRIDKKLLRNILINLISNAIKFSPQAREVKFILTCKNMMINIEVEDKGIGIPEEEKSMIFEAFHRSSNVSQIQGTGLGLSIVKKAIELQKGSISFSSIEQKGTTFKVKLPIHNEF